MATALDRRKRLLPARSVSDYGPLPTGTQFLEHFFTESDAVFFKSLGLNCIRIAINYRHFEDNLIRGS